MEERIKGATKQVKGSIKEAIGMIIGDPIVQAEGAAEKAAGEKQSTGTHSSETERPSNS